MRHQYRRSVAAKKVADGPMPTSRSLLEVSGVEDLERTRDVAPAGSVSILRRPAVIFSTVSAHSLKMRSKFEDAR